MMMFGDEPDLTKSKTASQVDSTADLEELKDYIIEELETLQSIYTEEDIIESDPEIITVAKHILEPRLFEEKKQSEIDETKTSIAAQLLQE